MPSRQAVSQARARAARKADGRCAVPGCPNRAAPDRVLCPEHLADRAARSAAHYARYKPAIAARRRAARKAAAARRVAKDTDAQD